MPAVDVGRPDAASPKVALKSPLQGQNLWMWREHLTGGIFSYPMPSESWLYHALSIDISMIIIDHMFINQRTIFIDPASKHSSSAPKIFQHHPASSTFSTCCHRPANGVEAQQSTSCYSCFACGKCSICFVLNPAVLRHSMVWPVTPTLEQFNMIYWHWATLGLLTSSAACQAHIPSGNLA